MGIIEAGEYPDDNLGRLVYRVRQIIAAPMSIIVFVIAVLTGLVFLAAAALLVIAALAVGFIFLVLWVTAIVISPHTINEDALADS